VLINLKELIDEIENQDSDPFKHIERISFENYLHKCSYCSKWENGDCLEKSLPNNCSWDGIMPITKEDKKRDRD